MKLEKRDMFKKIIIVLTVILVFMITFIAIYIKAPAATTKTLNNWSTVFKNKTFDLNKINDNKSNVLYKNYSNSNEVYTLESPYIEVNPYGNQLSAVIMFEKNEEIKNIDYKVVGKNQNTDINVNNVKYTTNENTIEIPIFGLYEDYSNKIEVSYEFQSGIKQTKEYTITTDPIEGVLTNIDIEVKNNSKYQEIMGNSLIFTSNLQGYDLNGDLRCNIIVDDYSTDKSINFEEFPNGIYIEPFMMFNNKKIIEVNLMGQYNMDTELELPEGYEYHHDLTVDKDGNYYVLGSIDMGFLSKVESVLGITDGFKDVSEDSIIMYDKDGNYIKTIDLGYLIENKEVNEINNAVENDLHLNAIEYWDDEDLISVSSRTSSDIYFINPETEDIEYILGESQDNSKYSDKYFKVLDEDNMVYTSGQHTAYEVNKLDTGNPEKEYLSVFDNKSCVNEYGNNNYKNQDGSAECQLVNASGVVYEIDFVNQTVKTVKEINIDSTSSTQGAFFTDDNSIIISSEDEDTYLYDENGNKVAVIKTSELKERYRVNILSKDDINNML